MITLETGRLKLIPLTQADLDWFHATNTDPFVRKYLWDDQVIARESARDILKVCEQLFHARKYGLWKVLEHESGASVGYTGLWTFFSEPQPQLLYALLPGFTGRAYATEAARRVIAYAFGDLGFSYVDASTDLGNAPSQRVCERLGMAFLGEKEMDGKRTLFYRIAP